MSRGCASYFGRAPGRKASMIKLSDDHDDWGLDGPDYDHTNYECMECGAFDDAITDDLCEICYEARVDPETVYHVLDVYEADLLNESPPRRETIYEVGTRSDTVAYATNEATARVISEAFNSALDKRVTL